MQFDLTQDETESLKNLKENLLIERGGTIGNSIRNKIKKGNKQLREKTQGRKPGLIVLFNNTMFDHVSPYKLMVAMHGLEEYKIDIETLTLSDRRLGPKKALTDKDNTSTSAIMILHHYGENTFNAQLFHNKHAACPLHKSLFKDINLKQFIMSSEQAWKKL